MTPTRQNRLAWMVVLLLFLGSVLNYLDRAVLGVVMPDVRRDLALPNADYGMAVNAFLLLYMIFYILGGRLADSFGSRRTFTLTVVCWSVAHALHALASGLRSLCLFRALLGIGEGGYYPTAMRGAALTELPDEALGRSGGPRHADAVALGEADETWPKIVGDAARGRLKDVYAPVLSARIANLTSESTRRFRGSRSIWVSSTEFPRFSAPS